MELTLNVFGSQMAKSANTFLFSRISHLDKLSLKLLSSMPCSSQPALIRIFHNYNIKITN